MHDYRATRLQRIAADIRYIARYGLGDIIAGIALMGLLILIPIITAIF